MKAEHQIQLAISNEQGECMGVITQNELMYRLSKKKVGLNDKVFQIALKKFRKVDNSMPLNELVRVLFRAPYAIVKSKNGKDRIITSADMTEFISADISPPTPVKEEEAAPVKEEAAPVKEEVPTPVKEEEAYEPLSPPDSDNSLKMASTLTILAGGAAAAFYVWNKN